MEDNKLNRLALVGTNSQGKTYMINQEFKGSKSKKAILIMNEVKADENLKNSTDTSTLITWLNSLLDNTNAKKALQEEINKVDLSSINENSFLNIGLSNNLESYKGIISAEIETDSNQWHKPGSGEKFLGQLLLISKILEDNKDDTYEYLVIDEPEQHLHPSLYIKVAKILNKISNQGIKVIIATHSPIITQYFVDDTSEICKIVDGICNPLPPMNDLIKISKEFDCYNNDELKLKDYKFQTMQEMDIFIHGLIKQTYYKVFQYVLEKIQLFISDYFEKLNNVINNKSNSRRKPKEPKYIYFIDFPGEVEERTLGGFTINIANECLNMYSASGYYEIVEKILSSSIQSEELRKDTPVEDFTEFIISTVYGMMLNWCMTDTKFEPLEHIDAINGFIISSLKPYMK